MKLGRKSPKQISHKPQMPTTASQSHHHASPIPATLVLPTLTLAERGPERQLPVELAVRRAQLRGSLSFSEILSKRRSDCTAIYITRQATAPPSTAPGTATLLSQAAPSTALTSISFSGHTWRHLSMKLCWHQRTSQIGRTSVPMYMDDTSI